MSTTDRPHHLLKLRALTTEDFPEVRDITRSLYANINAEWSRSQFERLLDIFPEGQLGIEDRGKIVAFVLAIVVDYNRYGDHHTYREITDGYNFGTHDPDGDVLYGIEVCVAPGYQGLRLGRRLYDARKELCERLNLRAIIAGGRMPGYSAVKERMTPREYIERVRHKELFDPVLTFQMNNDFQVRKVLRNYMPIDKESGAFATLIQWHNIYFEERPEEIKSTKVSVRVGVVQWQMRAMPDMATFYNNLEFFIDAVSDYHADFVVFPEYTCAPLMAQFNDLTPSKAIRRLAEFTEQIRQKFVEFSLSYNINIVAGTMPLVRDGNLYNASYLCRRDGTWEEQLKVHITPSELSDWGMVGGDTINVFDTDSGRVGILICYDVEFPELPRLMAEKGLQILFVPFQTDTQNGYHRVRHCAHARAIENECYVAIAGSVGNLPKVVNMDIQYAQSAVFSPSDFAFPKESVISETTPNTEMTIIADLELDLLKELHRRGSVRNLAQRRLDLYGIQWKGPEGKS